MRISTAYQFDSYSRHIARTQEKLFAAQTQVNTGRRINKPSDDPLGTASVMSMSSLKASLDQYSANLTTAKGNLGFNEQAMADTQSLAQRAYEITLKGANTSTDQAGRTAMAQEVSELQRRLVSIGNSQGPSGGYLFSGQKTDVQPFTVVGGALSYAGDANSVTVETSATDTMTISVPGTPLFNTLYSQLETLKNDLQSGSVSNLGDVTLGQIKASMETVSLARGDVGVKLQTVKSLTDQHIRRTDELVARKADIEEVDLSEAIMKYQAAQTAYQGSLNVASQGFKLSLMDFIRG